MALYHLHVKNISRGDGRSAVAAAAYRSGETLENAAEERQSKFAGRRDVIAAEILLPENAPAWMADRATLWNRVEAMERRKDARLAKEIEFSIPRELARSTWLDVAREMARSYVAEGFVVDLAVHDDGTGHNPHVHLLLATRAVTADRFGLKLRAADRKSFLKDTRTRWQAIANAALAKAGFAVKIDAGSYAARGIEREPGTHHAPDPAARRQRREEVAAMLRDSDIARVAAEIAADPAAATRYPNLSQRYDWPPQVRAAPGIFGDPVRQEERAYWAELRSRAAGEYGQQTLELAPEAAKDAPTPAQDRDPPRQADPSESLTDRVQTLWAKMQAAVLAPEAERHAARAEAARDYQRTFEQLNARVAQLGIMSPEGARLWQRIEREFRTSDFDDLLAEARRIEAKRNERGHMPEATRAQVREVEKLEREQREREGYEFKPRTRAAEMPNPPPVGDGKRPVRVQADERDAPAMAQPAAPAFPQRDGVPDPFTLLAQRGEAAAAAYAATRSGQPLAPARETPPDPFTVMAKKNTPERPATDPAPEPALQRQLPPDPFAYLKRPAPKPEDAATPTHDRTREWER